MRPTPNSPPERIAEAQRAAVYAASADAARVAYAAFERTWAKRCPGVVTSLREGGDEPLKLRRIDGWRKIAAVLCQDAAAA